MAITADVSTPIDDSRGGTFEWGKFQQDKEKIVNVYFEVPEGTRGKQVQVAILSKSLKIVALGKTLAAGEIYAPVVADECTWEMSEGKVLLTLEKQDTGWWPHVWVSDPPLDTSRFDDQEFMLGKMDDLQQNSMRSMVARMLGSDDPTDGKAPTLDPRYD